MYPNGLFDSGTPYLYHCHIERTRNTGKHIETSKQMARLTLERGAFVPVSLKVV